MTENERYLKREKMMANYFGMLIIVINLGLGGVMLLSIGCGSEVVRELVIARVFSGGAGQDGSNGIDGANGLDGSDGLPGADGGPGADGLDGIDGLGGEDGVDGQDGALLGIRDCWVECSANWQEPCAIVCPESGGSATRLTIEDAVPKP